VVKVAPLLERTGDFAAFLAEPFDEDAAYAALRRAETIGRPLGDEGWIKRLEREHGRTLAPLKRGRKPREQTTARDGAQESPYFLMPSYSVNLEGFLPYVGVFCDQRVSWRRLSAVSDGV
jgi:hypothetical protein